jgi:hypothetical protein
MKKCNACKALRGNRLQRLGNLGPRKRNYQRKIGRVVMQRLAKPWSATARRFESCIFRQVCWTLAQLVEHPTLTRSVASSILARSAIYFQSNSSVVERRPHKALVGGSCPPWTTKFFCLVSSIGSEHRFTKPGVARSNRVRGTSIFSV